MTFPENLLELGLSELGREEGIERASAAFAFDDGDLACKPMRGQATNKSSPDDP
jgi:hypothetical protein